MANLEKSRRHGRFAALLIFDELRRDGKMNGSRGGLITCNSNECE
jgi:hypothetical protein